MLLSLKFAVAAALFYGAVYWSTVIMFQCMAEVLTHFVLLETSDGGSSFAILLEHFKYLSVLF